MRIRSAPAGKTISGDIENGKGLYATCAACHGVNAEGNESLGSLNLKIADDRYLVTQLKNYKSGSRGANPGDLYGMQMRASAQILKEDDAIMDVVSYIATLENQ